MIDWISVVLPIRHKPIRAGHFMLFDSDGEILSNKPISQIFEGSHESKISLRTQGSLDGQGYASELFLSGNPSKFLQGHNVFGSRDLVGLLQGTLLNLIESAELDIRPEQVIFAIQGGIVSRIDITDSIQFQNRLQARSYIKQLSQIAHTRSGRPLQKKWTLAFQPSSRRWSLVVYSKGDEIQTHKLPASFTEKDFIHSQADSLVRVELRLKTLELLDLGLRHVQDLTEEKLNSIYSEFVRRVQMSEQVTLTDEQIHSLPRRLKTTFLLWREGVDIQAEMSKTTYYEHVSSLKKRGIDISVPYSGDSVNNVVPITTVIQGEAYQIPNEAYDKGLVYQPRKLRIV